MNTSTNSPIAEATRLRLLFPPLAQVSAPSLLDEALQRCLDARLLIDSEQQKIRALVEQSQTPIEHAAREYQHDLVAWQIERASEIAQERLRYFATLTGPEQQQAEKEKCAGDMLHWFKYYAWGFDPRPDSPLQMMPFVPFKFQENYLSWLNYLVFDSRSSGIVEKSRDMGATLGALCWAVYHFLFTDYFAAMLSSATEDLVDSKKDPDTLFEKVRFQLGLLPAWMLPKDFDLVRSAPYMNIANPANGAVLTGAAPTAKVGRQRRRSVVICDEFQTWPYGGYPQHTALSQTAKSLILLGTPEGKFNKYAEVRHSGHGNVFEMDWREHPWKDSRWYNSLPFGVLSPAMSPAAIAQEIDRNYEASQPGKVFKDWREEYILITWEELIAYYGKFGLGRKFINPATGQYRVPEDWSWGRQMDYGQTQGHPWIISHMGTPRENYPLHDSRFIFSIHRVTPTGASPAEGRAQYRQIEADLQLAGEPELSQMSHEQTGLGGLADTLSEQFGDFWEAWSTDYTVGIPQIQEWISVIDTTEPNPFRPALKGRARLYCVAPAAEYQFVFDQKHQRYFVTPSASARGFKLFREEMPSYHYPPEELGKPVQKMRPRKIRDDCIDTLRGFAVQWGPSVRQLTALERRVKKLPDDLQPKVVLAHLGQTDFTELYMAQQHAMQHIKRAEEKQEDAEAKAWGRFLGRPAGHRRYHGGRK